MPLYAAELPGDEAKKLSASDLVARFQEILSGFPVEFSVVENRAGVFACTYPLQALQKIFEGRLTITERNPSLP